MGSDLVGQRGPPRMGSASAHFVTLVSRERALLFGRVVDERVVLSEAGRIVAEEWRRAPAQRGRARLGEFTVMPNHLHGIVWLGRPAGKAGRRARRSSSASEAAVLGALISRFKAASTRRINTLSSGQGGSAWQPGYRALAIDDERELEAIRRLIYENPARWAEDVENPNRQVGATKGAQPSPQWSLPPTL
jgi:putative transposase